MKYILYGVMSLFTATAITSEVYAQSNPVIKVDINHSGGRDEQTTEDGYVPWKMGLNASIQDSLEVQGVKFFIRLLGSKGSGLSTSWYKNWAVDVANINQARLVSDGVTVKDGNGGAKMELRIKGLPLGAQSLLVYLNYVDGYQTVDVAPINVYLNDVLYAADVHPTVRANNANARFVYLTFDAAESEDVVVRFEASESSTALYKNVFINGFELNVGDLSTQAQNPVPANADGHVVTSSKETVLQWDAANEAISHDIYFGINEQAIYSADKSSEFFKGNFTINSYTADGLYSMNTYYWRVDEVYSDRTVKGRVWSFTPAQLAFPGAEGYGRYARGGRGGKVVYVTNLNDSGPGSLREAVTNNIGPRTIVFNVGGVIKLESRLTLSDPYVTIAGQTAPGKGICIRNKPFGYSGNDVIIRNMRLRLGAGPTNDGMGLTGNHSIMDHCSISWTIDEAFSSRNSKNITLQKTLISEALNVAGHQNYPAGTEHGYAATVGGNTASLHHNLLAHCYGRNWSLGGGLDADGYFASRLDITNNVVYNWGSRATDGGAHEVNFVNNYYKPGAGTTFFYALNAQYENVGKGTQKYYFAGNVMPGRFNESNQTQGRKYSLSNGNPALTYDPFVNTPFFASYVTTQSATHAYKIVLSDVGANQPVLDEHDIRMVKETLNGTYSVVGSVSNKKGFPDTELDAGGFESYPEVSRKANWDSDKDGLPDWWETIKGTNINSAPNDFSDANDDSDGDGITELEFYLQWMAEPHYQSVNGETINIDLQKLSMGFTNLPVYTLSNVAGGSAITTGGVVQFTPNGAGLASFDFTVTDGEGHDMTRKVNVVTGADLTQLPVHLVTLAADRKNGKEVELKWETVHENNNSHFEILRSNNGEAFENLGAKISSKALNGISTTNLYYDFTDNNNNVDNTYYQLVQVDRDGAKNLSEIKVVKGNPVVFNVWPIPSKGDIFVSVGALKDPALLMAFDVLGKQLLTDKISFNQTKKLTIQTKGIVIIRIKSPSGNELFVKKVLVE
ncbi:hypothetical protein BCY91_13600 [Pelobium manganitolerans]|uniref:Pectate lyase n=1 Tax=Pelobium manganitolerans TaxID=1842495 RepID=A0A419SAZ0_9SPHI|nr:T9SS C-terminal target domain-containing protein [Pelobium manganitolerans]RKD19617.1 hypothetical protein BCY91_13600 [Pelobium manganitolerans]